MLFVRLEPGIDEELADVLRDVCRIMRFVEVLEIADFGDLLGPHFVDGFFELRLPPEGFDDFDAREDLTWQ